MPYKDPKSPVAKASQSRSYYRNKEKIIAKRKKYKLENPEKIKKQQKIYNKRHQPKANKRIRERRKNDPEYRKKINEYGKKWRRKNPEKQALYKKKSILKNQYGLTVEDYQKLVEKNNGGCHICNEIKPGTNCRNGLCVDHDHKTGKIRGLLCHSCNRAIGLLGDDIKKLEKAIDYLKK